MSDIVIIAEDATWGPAQFRGGGGYLGPALAALIGQRKTREIEFRTAKLTGRDAVEIGWANHAVEREKVVTFADEIARDIARTPRETLVVRKAGLNRLMDLQGFKQSMEDGALVHTILTFSDGVKAIADSLRAGGVHSALAEWSTTP